MSTVALGSIRKQIESTAPPRGLWCDFPLGRPLGKPGDPDFQHRVLAAAFGLLDSSEPVVTEFGESIADEGNEVLACPLPPRHDPNEPFDLRAQRRRRIEEILQQSKRRTDPTHKHWPCAEEHRAESVDGHDQKR